MYEPRFYRRQFGGRFKTFNVAYKETDLMLLAPCKLSDLCFNRVRGLRKQLENFIEKYPFFAESLKPVPLKMIGGSNENGNSGYAAPEIKKMIEASKKAGVGPMASVAGLFAEECAKAVLERTPEVIVENGGDIFLKVDKDCKIGLFPGKDSPFNGKLKLKIKSKQTPLGICSSSGNMGHSYSEGCADMVTVLSTSAVLADAAATSAANLIKSEDDISLAVDKARSIEGITGVIALKNDKIGVWGEVEFA